MSITLYASKPETYTHDGVCGVMYRPLAPAGYDPNQVIGQDDYGPIHAENPWHLNLANANCSAIFSLLGLSDCLKDGTVECTEPALVWLRCTEALELLRQMPELGVKAGREIGDSRGCRWIDCGWDEGYLESKLIALAQLAQVAIEHDGILFGA